MTINYVLREGRRGSVGNGSLRKSFNDFLIGDVGGFIFVDCDPVGMESGGRDALLMGRTDWWLTRIGVRIRSTVALLINRTKKRLSSVSKSIINDSRIITYEFSAVDDRELVRDCVWRKLAAELDR